MTLRVNSNNIQSDTLATISGPRVSNVQITDSSYSVIDDTAVDVAGGYIKITGSNFVTGCQVLVDVTAATTVTFVSSSEVRAQVPAKTAGTYTVYLVNPNGDTAIRVNGLTYSAFPAWSTGSTLPSGSTETLISIQLSAPSNSTVSYALAAGNTLPTGLTLSNVGLLSGTITGLTVETTYNFTVVATDLEYQDTSRAFSITITVGDSYWTYVTTLLSPTLSTLPFNDDASTNNFAVTIAGDTRPYNFNPYTPGYYSNYFNGSSGLTWTPVAGQALGTGDFTIECWIYGTAAYSGYTSRMFVMGDGAGSYPTFFIDSSNKLNAGYAGVSVVTSSGTVPINQWVHLAVVKSSGTLYVYINGVANGSASDTANYIVGSNAYLGKDSGTNYFQGYISNFRIVKGTALYTSTFTLPTGPLTAISGTVFLTSQSNRFIDTSSTISTLALTSAPQVQYFNPYTPSSSYSTYGSTYFDGNGDYMAVANNTAFNCGTGDFTLECWFYDDGSSTSYPSIFSSTDWATGTGGVSLRYNNTGAANKFYVAFYASNSTPTGGSGVNELMRTTNTYPTKTWHHVAFVRSSGNVFSLYVNGVRDTTTTSSGITIDWSLNANGPKIGGGNWDGANSYIKGYVSNLRLVKGTALYTGTTYTVPTQPLTAITNTSLLTCQTNQPAANNTFIDNSTSNFAITRNGNTTQGTFSPYGENWSNYFDGTGDYLSFSAVTSPTTGDFTVEFWFYNTRSAWTTAFDITDGGTGAMALYFGSGGDLRIAPQAQSSTPIASVSGLSLNTWIHFAVIRSSGSLRAYANGSALAVAIVYTTSLTGFTKVGGSTDGYALGYISNFRYTTNAVYSIAGSTITVPTSPLQPIAGTQLLTCQSPNIVDKSPSNLSITKNGDVSVQKFGPFAGTTLPSPYYSAYFDGTGDYLSLSTIQNFGTADFTVEAWVYLTAVNTNGIYASTGGTGKSRLYTHITNTSKLQATLRNSDGTNEIDYTGSTTINLNTWYHVAIVRYNNTLYLYVNGVSDMTPTPVTQNLSTNDSFSTVGSANATRLFNGYMSNLRVVAGTAVYTANFTPPTSPLTAITNTSLLTCQSSPLVDNSINNVTITVNGDTKPRTFNPFTVSYSTGQSYTPAVFGGSMYFDGTGDYVTVSTLTPATSLSSGNWTIECWFYASATKTFAQIIGNRSTATGSTSYVPIAVSYESATIKLYSSSNGSSWNISNAGTIGTVTLQSWNHVAVVRNGNNLEAYLNGIKVTISTGLSGISYTATNLFYASGAVDPFAGYISDVRLVTGTALYTSNFVPENRPLTAVRNSTLLLNGTGAGIYDSSENAVFETVGDAKLSTTTVKFAGTTSVYFDGTGDYLVAPNSPNLNFGAGDFTIEMWLYPTVLSGFKGLLGQRATENNYSPVLLEFNGATLTCQVSTSGSAWAVNFSSSALTVNAWTHIAMVRNTSTVTLYVNGVSAGSGTATGSLMAPVASTYLGANSGSPSGAGYFSGYISDFRITRGVARYTANFTAPTESFTTK